MRNIYTDKNLSKPILKAMLNGTAKGTNCSTPFFSQSLTPCGIRKRHSSGAQGGVGVNTVEARLAAPYTVQVYVSPACGWDALHITSMCREAPVEHCGKRRAKSRPELSQDFTREAALAFKNEDINNSLRNPSSSSVRRIMIQIRNTNSFNN